MSAVAGDLAETLTARLQARSATIGVIGLGYVGLPLAAAAARVGFSTIGFDIDPQKPERLNRGDSYIGAVPNQELARLIAERRFKATDDFALLADCDVVAICVPTPSPGNASPTSPTSRRRCAPSR